MHIIIGLGNPGVKYEKTRHNMGYRAADKLAERNGIEFRKEKFDSLVGEGMIGGERIIVAKPLTYMNLSGQAARKLISFYKIPADNMIIVYDDIDLPIGSLRIRKSGGAGTHNGMRSICEEVGTGEFIRVRLGIGNSGGDLINYVIGKVPRHEQTVLNETAEAGAKAVEDIIKYGADEAMNMDNLIRHED